MWIPEIDMKLTWAFLCYKWQDDNHTNPLTFLKCAHNIIPVRNPEAAFNFHQQFRLQLEEFVAFCAEFHLTLNSGETNGILSRKIKFILNNFEVL